LAGNVCFDCVSNHCIHEQTLDNNSIIRSHLESWLRCGFHNLSFSCVLLLCGTLCIMKRVLTTYFDFCCVSACVDVISECEQMGIDFIGCFFDLFLSTFFQLRATELFWNLGEMGKGKKKRGKGIPLELQEDTNSALRDYNHAEVKFPTIKLPSWCDVGNSELRPSYIFNFEG
jgi:hypothetical protein